MYHAFWRHALFVRGQSFSVKMFDRSRSGCQLSDWERETIFVSLPGRRSLSPPVSPSRALVLSCAHYFQAPATQATVKWPIEPQGPDEFRVNKWMPLAIITWWTDLESPQSVTRSKEPIFSDVFDGFRCSSDKHISSGPCDWTWCCYGNREYVNLLVFVEFYDLASCHHYLMSQRLV